MTLLENIRHLWEHAFRADAQILDAIEGGQGATEALREYAHIIGAEETWLARIEKRPALAAVWPDLSIDEARSLRAETEGAYRAFLSDLQEEDLLERVTYTNSAGQEFTNAIGDILTHVVMHGQYHRGKINLLLRQAGQSPAPTDYIAFLRGVPAATEATARRGAE